MRLEVLTDATAARGIASRTGLGKTRHIEVHYLWVQEKIAQKAMTLSKVWGHENPADLLTKHLDQTTRERFTEALGLEPREGRSGETPTLNEMRAAKAKHRLPLVCASGSHRQNQNKNIGEGARKVDTAEARGSARMLGCHHIVGVPARPVPFGAQAWRGIQYASAEHQREATGAKGATRR